MGNLVIDSEPADYTSVFLPIVVSYDWENNSCLIQDNGGNLQIRVSILFDGFISVGDFVQVLNGSYQGSYKVTSLSTDASYVYITTNGTYSGADSLSNLFNIDQRQSFELYAGYESGTGATVKPYQKIADISVAINPNTNKFDIPIQSYLRSYFEITSPTVGKDYGLSLQWKIKPINGTLTDFKYSYYSANQIDSQIVGENVPLGNVPLTYLNQSGASNIPTLFSIIDSGDEVNNVITGVESITTSSTSINVALITGQSITVNIIKDVGNWGAMTLEPVLSWVNITSVVDNVLTIEIDTDTTGAGDYASVDYSNEDYLTTGINSIVGNYDFSILENAIEVVTLSVSVYPTTQIRRICKENSLNFAWLNRSGGWNSYAIECKYVKGYDIGGEQTYLDAGSVLRRTEVQNVYQNYSLTADLLTTFELDLLSSLRTSIQAYLYNDNTLAFDIPIIIDSGSFQTYGNRQRQTERSASFNFRLATKEVIQTQ